LRLPDARKGILFHRRGLEDSGRLSFPFVRLVDKGILQGVKKPFTNVRDISQEGIIKLIKDAKVIFHDDSGDPSP